MKVTVLLRSRDPGTKVRVRFEAGGVEGSLPLSVAYINPAGVIVEIHDLEPLDEQPVPSAFPNIAYALEMEQGWFSENGILAGDRMQGLPASSGQ